MPRKKKMPEVILPEPEEVTPPELMTEEEYRKKFTENLKRIRLRAKLTQKKAGLLCGYNEKIAERMYQQWEYGKILPQGYSLYRLSKALKCTTDDLLMLD